MDLERAGDLELLDRLEDIICGEKMIGVEAAAIAMKQDAERYRLARSHEFRLIDLRDEERLDAALKADGTNATPGLVK